MTDPIAPGPVEGATVGPLDESGSQAGAPAPVLPERLDAEAPLTESEQTYARASIAANTARAYASDWAEFTSWCRHRHLEALPASPAALSGYLAELADAGAAVATINRRLAAIGFVHARAGLPDPAAHPRVRTVWAGIRRTRTRTLRRAKPLMPPDLLDVLDACPTTRIWKNPRRADEPDLGGVRDRALLLVGFVGALRRSELAAIRVRDLHAHNKGLVLTIPRSKTNQDGRQHEQVVLPRSARPALCPVTAITTWVTLAGITGPDAPILQGVTRHNRPTGAPLHPESINTLVQHAITRAGLDADGYSAHSLRAGFVTYAHLRGASDRAITHQTRHRSLATLDAYIRLETAWRDNAATTLGL